MDYIACQAPLSMGFPRKNTGGGCHFLFQGIFLTQRSNPISCVTCIGREISFASEPPGKPQSIKRLTLNQTSQFIIYLSCFCFTVSMWLEVFLYAVVILITFVLPRKVSLNSLGFVLCLSLEKGNWTNSLNREISLWGYGNAINWPGFSLSPLDNILSQKITIHNVSLSEDDTSVMFWNHHYWFLFWKINI